MAVIGLTDTGFAGSMAMVIVEEAVSSRVFKKLILFGPHSHWSAAV